MAFAGLDGNLDLFGFGRLAAKEPAPLTRRVGAGVPAAFGVGTNFSALAFGGFGYRFFSALDLGCEGGLSGLGGRCGGLFGNVSRCRALRRRQVCELQIHRLDRHGPVLLPARFVLL